MGKPDTANMSQEQTKQARKQQRKARAALHSRSSRKCGTFPADEVQASSRTIRSAGRALGEPDEPSFTGSRSDCKTRSPTCRPRTKLGQRRKAPLQIGRSEQGFLARGPHYGCREGK